MLKRVCDRCEKEICDDETWYSIRCEKVKENDICCCGRTSELCEKCYNDFFAQFANNN